MDLQGIKINSPESNPVETDHITNNTNSDPRTITSDNEYKSYKRDNVNYKKSFETIATLRAEKEHYTNRLSTFRVRAWIAFVGAVIGGLLGYVWCSLYLEVFTINQATAFIILGALITEIMYLIYAFTGYFALQNFLKDIDYKLARLGAEELKETIDEDFFTKLVQINFKYIDQYYLQTQEQANKSFKLAVFAAVSGFFIICVGIAMMYNTAATPAYVTTASGVISEFIAAVFFYLYNQTVLKMAQYHQKLVITQNISLALKITDGMPPEAKAKSYEILIDRLTTDINKHLVFNSDNQVKL